MTTHLTRVAFLMAIAHLTLELGVSFLPVIYPILITSMGLTYGQIGLIAMVSSLSGSVTQPLFGYLSDRWGPS
ncbi:MAG: MFS transporter, partial [Anaerolineae bacterium]|nr:MFS transporter [Anaerolineae bacterium]